MNLRNQNSHIEGKGGFSLKKLGATAALALVLSSCYQGTPAKSTRTNEETKEKIEEYTDFYVVDKEAGINEIHVKKDAHIVVFSNLPTSDSMYSQTCITTKEHPNEVFADNNVGIGFSSNHDKFEIIYDK